MKIGKEFHWEMGHRLPSHKGACRNMHGHSYRMVVEVEGSINPETGMLIDFGDISKIVKPVVAEFDHAFLCERSDTEVLSLLERLDMKRVVMDEPSTVENICGVFVTKLHAAIGGVPEIDAFTVRIWETATSVAEVRTEV